MVKQQLQRKREIFLCILCFALPLLCSYLQETETVSTPALELFRGSNLIAIGLFFLLHSFHKQNLREWYKGFLSSPYKIAVYIAILFIITISILTNNSSLQSMMKGILQIGSIGVIMFLIPLSFSKQNWDVKTIALSLIFITIVATLYNIYFHYTGNPLNGRLIFPVNIDKLLLMSWIISYVLLQRQIISTLMMFFLLWTGSLTEVFIACILYAAYIIYDRKSWRNILYKAVVPPLFLVFCLISLNHITTKNIMGPYYLTIHKIFHSVGIDIDTKIFYPINTVLPELTYFTEKKQPDLLGGRKEIFIDTVNKLEQDKKWLFGYGKHIKILRSNGQKSASHNAFLETLLTYGILYALLCQFIWFRLFMPITTKQQDNLLRSSIITKWSLFTAFTGITLLHSLFWTSMTDAYALATVILLLVPYNHEQKNGGQSV